MKSITEHMTGMLYDTGINSEMGKKEMSDNTYEELSNLDWYRETVFDRVRKDLKQFCNLDFEINYGKVSTDNKLINMQLLVEEESRNRSNGFRMSWEQQRDHILLLYKAMLVCRNVGDESSDYVDNSEVLEKILESLRVVY